VYVDRHSIYRDDDHPDKPTQFGRAASFGTMVELICAHSPQAKGRVERRNAVFQDRLVKEMRLRNIRSMEAGNALLEGQFLADLDRRYAVSPHQDTDLHRVLDASILLAEVLCVQEVRVVGRDWCVRWQNRWLQIEVRHAALNLAGRKVLVKRCGDGCLVVEYQGERLTCRELEARPVAAKSRKVAVNNRSWKPAADHPWKRYAAGRPIPPVSLAPAAPARDLQAGKKRNG
jgi:hypothetical protein